MRDLGFGYRAKYIVKSCLQIELKGGENYLLGLRSKKLDVCRDELQELMGVGNKVADCIALFSLDKADCVPVDTHVFQIAKRFGFVTGDGLNKTKYLEIN